MNGISLLGYAAAIFTSMAFFPQVIKAHKSRETKDLSLIMYMMFSFGLILWTGYGFMLAQPPIIAANGITLLMSFYIIYLKIKYG